MFTDVKTLTDAEIIDQLLRAKGSRALWNADPDLLGDRFPSDADTFDHSSADTALMILLAIWTDNDETRMDQLFRQSALMRPKYEARADYREQLLKSRPDFNAHTTTRPC